jgi:predicted signal transduction protein with EAL and GGDEF domain
MAHSLRLESVAEGVETQEQVEFLMRHGCPVVQGFLYSKPLPATELTAWLRARDPEPGPLSGPVTPIRRPTGIPRAPLASGE